MDLPVRLIDQCSTKDNPIHLKKNLIQEVFLGYYKAAICKLDEEFCLSCIIGLNSRKSVRCLATS